MTRQFVAGGEGAGSDPDIFALLYKNILGANIKLVSGYPWHERYLACNGAGRSRWHVRHFVEHN